MDFNSVIGQNEVKGSLKRALSEGRVGHAYIFTGPAGIGKKTIAHIFAGLLLCEDTHDGAACGKCKACLLFRNGSNPDYHRINTEDASIGVDLIREIQSDVAIKPMYSGRKVYIIEDAVKMTDQAQNCLLKTFEEPPPYVVVILLTTNYESLLETIRSRAQRLNFRKYTHEQVCQAVAESCNSDSNIIELAAGYSDGNIGMALELAGSVEFTQLRDRVFSLLAGVTKGKVDEILEFTEFLEENRDSTELILDVMLLYYRDLLVMCETGNEKMLINSDKKDMICNNARMYCSQRVIDSISAVEAARRALKQNANYQLVIDDMLIRLRED
ncbi:MAG: DNA polymerase III subunit delta' [Clostridiaceae bacterium]